MLERWGVIPRGSLRSAVAKLGIDVNKVISPSKNAVKACVNFLEKNPTDLIVLAVRQESGRMRWLEKSVGKPIARAAGQMTFYSRGMEALSRQMDQFRQEYPAPGHEQAASTARLKPPLTDSQLRLALGGLQFSMSPAAEMPSIKIPTDSRWTWRLAKAGTSPRIILQTATNLHSDLIVMTTDGLTGL